MGSSHSGIPSLPLVRLRHCRNFLGTAAAWEFPQLLRHELIALIPAPAACPRMGLLSDPGSQGQTQRWEKVLGFCLLSSSKAGVFTRMCWLGLCPLSPCSGLSRKASLVTGLLIWAREAPGSSSPLADPLGVKVPKPLRVCRF